MPNGAANVRIELQISQAAPRSHQCSDGNGGGSPFLSRLRTDARLVSLHVRVDAYLGQCTAPEWLAESCELRVAFGELLFELRRRLSPFALMLGRGQRPSLITTARARRSFRANDRDDRVFRPRYAGGATVAGGAQVVGRRTCRTSMPSSSIASVVASICTCFAPEAIVGIRKRPFDKRL
jgi:hypothetical protein